jgi:hypothetical protein
MSQVRYNSLTSEARASERASEEFELFRDLLTGIDFDFDVYVVAFVDGLVWRRELDGRLQDIDVCGI